MMILFAMQSVSGYLTFAIVTFYPMTSLRLKYHHTTNWLCDNEIPSAARLWVQITLWPIYMRKKDL